MLTKEDRLRKMDAYLAERVAPIFQGRAQETIDYFTANKEKLLQGLLSSLKEAVGFAKPKIESGEKQSIKYIQFSYLLSAVLMKELWLKIDLYDTRHYADLSYTGSYWDYKELFSCVDADIEQLRGELAKQFTRVKDYEILDLRMHYHVGVFALVEEILRGIVSEAGFAAVLSEVFEPEVIVLFGAYLGQSEVIAIIREGCADGLFSC